MNGESNLQRIDKNGRTDNRLRVAVHSILQAWRPCLRRGAAILGIALVGSASLPAIPEPFPPIFPLASLLPGRGGDGNTGFVLRGIAPGDRSGHAVAGAGDVNGDGIDDLLIGGEYADPHGRIYAGESYVVFGTRGVFPAAFELSSLLTSNGGDGSIGFVLQGAEPYDASSFALSGVGDVNGDGIDDLLIAAVAYGQDELADAYVVFGRDTKQGRSFPGEFPLAKLLPGQGGDGSLGFVIKSIDIADFLDVSAGRAGDINGDGIGDLVIGAPWASHGRRLYAGETYVVFGRDTARAGDFPAVVWLESLLPKGGGDGSDGFVINGIHEGDLSGHAVDFTGDVNGDGIDDLIIGSPTAHPRNKPYAGESYVIFGRSTAHTSNFPPEFPLGTLKPAGGGDGSLGFVLTAVSAYDNAGGSVSGAGDVNGDGISDLIIGAREAAPGGREYAGQSYVVFGRDTVHAGNFPAIFPLASLLPAGGGDGSAGFVLNGIHAGDGERPHGVHVRGAGDLNEDGIDDLAIGARSADPHGREDAGQSYVVFGRDTAHVGNFPAVFPLAGLLPARGGDGSAGFVLNGIDAYDDTRWLNAAGDVNGDGVDDLVLGARGADPGGREDAGESYVVFGRPGGRKEQ